MKKMFAALVLLTLVGCGTHNTVAPTLNSKTTQSQVEAKFLNSIKGFAVEFEGGYYGLAFKAKSVTGKTMEACNYSIDIEDVHPSANALESTLRLGKDGNLYCFGHFTKEGQSSPVEGPFLMGTWKASSVVEGAPIEFKLNKGISIDADWNYLNPMGHDDLGIVVKNSNIAGVGRIPELVMARK